MLTNELFKKVNHIFTISRLYCEDGDFEKMDNERNKLKEMVKNHIIEQGILDNFDADMKYVYNQHHSL